MKMKLIPVVLLLAACSQGTMQSTSEAKNGDWSIEVESSNSGTVTIKLTNNTDASLSILDPMNKVVQKKSEESWDRINLTYCLCEVSCPPPPEERRVSAGSVYTFSWDKKEKSCNGNKTVGTTVSSGSFQAVIAYTKNGATQKLTVPFEY